VGRPFRLGEAHRRERELCYWCTATIDCFGLNIVRSNSKAQTSHDQAPKIFLRLLMMRISQSFPGFSLLRFLLNTIVSRLPRPSFDGPPGFISMTVIPSTPAFTLPSSSPFLNRAYRRLSTPCHPQRIPLRLLQCPAENDPSLF